MRRVDAGRLRATVPSTAEVSYLGDTDSKLPQVVKGLAGVSAMAGTVVMMVGRMAVKRGFGENGVGARARLWLDAEWHPATLEINGRQGATRRARRGCFSLP